MSWDEAIAAVRAALIEQEPDWLGRVLAYLWAALDDQHFTIVGALVVAILLAILGWFAGLPGRLARLWRRLRGTGNRNPTLVPLPDPTPYYQPDQTLMRGLVRHLRDRRAATVCCLHGMGGIGKSEAALVAARTVIRKGRFRDGAVRINLEGFREDGDPLGAEDALRRLIAMTGGEPPGARPDHVGEDQWVAHLRDLWLKLTAGRDLLVILDNARDGEQVRPLLPGGGGPRVILTSRQGITLGGRAELFEVAKLDDARARRLAAELVPGLGKEETDRLIAVSLGLPLLMEALAGVIREETETPPARWLDIFEAAGAEAGLKEVERVRARLGASVDALAPEDRARYAALSLFPASFHAKPAYAVWGMASGEDGDDPEATRALGRLHKRKLLNSVDSEFAEILGPRYRLPGYLRPVARSAFDALPPSERRDFQHRWSRGVLEVLLAAESLYRTKGGARSGLRLYEQEEATIAAAQSEVADRPDRDDTAAELAMHFRRCLESFLTGTEYSVRPTEPNNRLN